MSYKLKVVLAQGKTIKNQWSLSPLIQVDISLETESKLLCLKNLKKFLQLQNMMLI